MAYSFAQQVSTILYIENNEDDIALFERALKYTHNVHLLPFSNLQAAEDYLLQQAKADGGHPPDLLFVDYKLSSDQTGLGFFSWEKEHPELRHIPTIIFSGDDFPDFIKACYEKGADLFLLKPVNFHGWQKLGELLVKCLSATPPQVECLREEPFYRPPP